MSRPADVIPLAVVLSETRHVPFLALPPASVIGAAAYVVAPGLRQKSVAVATPPASVAFTVNVTSFGAVGQ